MTLKYFFSSKRKPAGNARYSISQFDGDAYYVIDSFGNREVCVCSNYDDWEDAEDRAKLIMKTLNENNDKTPYI